MNPTLDVLNVKGEKVGTVAAPEALLNAKGSSFLVHEVVRAHLANERRGTHSTKTRGEVSGGGIKPWKQKHTGRARSGSTRSPLWRHGGIIFGPKPRSYYQAIPRAKRMGALRSVFLQIWKQDRVRVLDAFTIPEPKTKRVAAIVKKLNLPAKTILVLAPWDTMVVRAARNVDGFHVVRLAELNSYELLWAEAVVFTKESFNSFLEWTGFSGAPEGAEAEAKS